MELLLHKSDPTHFLQGLPKEFTQRKKTKLVEVQGSLGVGQDESDQKMNVTLKTLHGEQARIKKDQEEDPELLAIMRQIEWYESMCQLVTQLAGKN